MTGSQCVQFCSNNGNYSLAGVEYGIQCFCTNHFQVNGNNTNVAPESIDKGECDMPCSGNAKEACGGNYKVTIYEKKDSDIEGSAVRLGKSWEMAAMIGLVVGGLAML